MTAEKIRKCTPQDVDAANGLAHVYKALGKPEEAFKELGQAMCIAGASNGEMETHLGRCYHQQ